MAGRIIGIDWAASGLKVAAMRESRRLSALIPWAASSSVPPALGQAAVSALREFVETNGLAGSEARVALHRRDFVLVSSPAGAMTPPEDVWPRFGWRCATLRFEGVDGCLLAGIESACLERLHRFLESAGLRFTGVVLLIDPHGSGAMTVDLGAGGAQILFRRPGGLPRLQRVEGGDDDVRRALAGVPVTAVHLTGGGALDEGAVERLGLNGAEMVRPRNAEAAVFGTAWAAANGGGFLIGHRAIGAAGKRPLSAFTAAVSALALVLSVAAEVPARTEAPVLSMAAGRSEVAPSSIVERALRAVPTGVALTDLIMDGPGGSLSLRGTAETHGDIERLVTSLSADSFRNARCTRAAETTSRRLAFDVAAGYAAP